MLYTLITCNELTSLRPLLALAYCSTQCRGRNADFVESNEGRDGRLPVHRQQRSASDSQQTNDAARAL